MRFNVIGHISSEIGLGIMAADLVRALDAAGHEVRALDVELGLGRKGRSRELDRFCVREGQLYRDGVDVSVFPISAVDHWQRYRFGAQRVAVPLWELPEVNPRWAAGLRSFDAIWAPSDFIGDTLERAGLRVVRAPWPHYITAFTPTLVQAARARLGWPDNTVVFTFAFDPSSDVQRKNPGAVVEAFMQADMANSLLCIQLNRSAEGFADLDRWLAGLPPERVRVINRHLSHAEAVQLIAASDVYVSLHRAEGLGLGMLEAMMLGKPVIATGWSGNLSFMNAESACLVDAPLRPLNGQIPAYTPAAIGCETAWSEPSIEHAAWWMRLLATNEMERALIGEAARQQAEQYAAQARDLRWLEQLKPASRPSRSIGPDTIRRLLVYTPTWIDPDSGRQALHPKVRAAIERAITHTRQSMSVDIDWVVGVDNPWPIPDHRNVLHQYQRARAMTLDAGSDYDALLTIEHDNLLPDDAALDRLLETPGDVVYAPYVLRHGTPTLSTWQWVNNRNLGMSLDRYPDELAQARRAVIWPVSGAGMGCTLFRRRALELIEFEATASTNPCPDLGFAVTALRAGLTSYGRFDVPVAHYSRGKWLIPFEECETMQFIARETGQVMAGERIIRLVAGKPIDLTEAEAAVLAALGKIGLVDPPVAGDDDDSPIMGDEHSAEVITATAEAAIGVEVPTTPPPPSRRGRSPSGPKGK